MSTAKNVVTNKKRKAVASGAIGRKKTQAVRLETVKALKARLKVSGLPVSGKKAELLARLAAAAASQPEAETKGIDEAAMSASPVLIPPSPPTGDETDGAAANDDVDASTLTAPSDAADVTWATDATHPTKKPMYTAVVRAPPKAKRAKKGAAAAESEAQATHKGARHLYDALPEVLQETIVDMALGNSEYRDPDFAKRLKMLSSVDTVFAETVTRLCHGACGHAISSTTLKAIKAQATMLDFSPSGSMLVDFKSAVEDKWGGVTVRVTDSENNEYAEDDALAVVVEHNGGWSYFGKQVAREYKAFLVVKACETLIHAEVESAQEPSSGPKASDQSVWLEKAQPSKLVDLMWHSHMLQPRRYYEDCNKLLLGRLPVNIIDHEPTFVSPKSVPGSSFADKKKKLFKFELCGGYRHHRHSYGSLPYSFKIFDSDDGGGRGDAIENLACAIMEDDMNGANDCG